MARCALETVASPEVPTTSDEALRLAVHLAVDAGEYERAAVVLDLLRRTTSRLITRMRVASSMRDLKPTPTATAN